MEPYVVPYAPFIADQFLIMQDNIRPHIAGTVRDYLEETNITTMVGPAKSPDLVKFHTACVGQLGHLRKMVKNFRPAIKYTRRSRKQVNKNLDQF